MKIFKKINLKKGFTLIEMTVVITIIILLSSFFFANYHSGEKMLNLKRSAHQLSQIIRKAEELSLSSQEISFQNQPDPGLPKGGYGIYVDKNNIKYILFADCNDSHDFNKGSGLNCDDLDIPVDETMEEFFLEKKVIVDQILAGGNSAEKIYITFIPPDPTIRIYSDQGGPHDTAQIILKCENQTKSIYINSVGLIDID